MHAIDAALNIYRRPNLVRAERRKALPDNIISLIRIASGDNVALEFLTTDRAKSETEAREASVFYIQQVLLSPRSDEYRQLGLTNQATPQQISEHKRHMLKWLHPDRNPNKWESALFQRVVNAAEKLENQSAAVEFHSRQNVKPNSFSSIRMPPSRKLRRTPAKRRIQKTNVLRWLRKLIVFGSALFIVLFLAWKFYVGRWFEWYESQVVFTLPLTLHSHTLQPKKY